MEAMESGKEFENENSQRTPRKRGPKRKKEMKESSFESCMEGAPRTRSQVAPDWTPRESLILVNEISAVEGDCLKALSSYQKWKIIVQNCATLDVPRTLNQCRSKWNSLINDYNQIKQWDSNSNTHSYWILDFEHRNQFLLPENFDYDLFVAIDNYVRAQKDHSDTDPDTDPEAEADLLNVMAKLGSKRHRRHFMSLKIQPEEKPENCCAVKHPQEVHAVVEPQNSCEEVNPQTCSGKEMPQVVYDKQQLGESHLEEMSQESNAMEKPQTINAAEEPQQSLVEEKPKGCRGRRKKIVGMEEEKQMAMEEKPKGRCGRKKKITGTEDEKQIATEEKPKTRRGRKQKTTGTEEEKQLAVAEKPKAGCGRRKKTMGTEEEKQMAVQKLCENAEMIHAITQGNFPETADFGASDVKSVQDFKTDFARRQGDMLIACLGDIVAILDKFPDLVQECVKFSSQSDIVVSKL